MSVARDAATTLKWLMRQQPDPPQVSEPPRHRVDDAILAAFGGSNERLSRYRAASASGSPQLVLAVQSAQGNYTHCALLNRYPGRTAMLLVTSPRAPSDVDVGAALIRAAVAQAGKHDVLIVQALIEPLRTQEREMFELGGLRTLGTLAYFERPRSRAAQTLLAAPLGTTIRAHDPAERALLERLLEATYVDSLDCPGLSRMRPTRDILDGHIQTGRFDPRRWLILEVGGQPAGVSMLSEVSSARSDELVYFGLAPWARGKGLAGLLLDETLSLARERSVTLACDRANTPAMRLYESRGFVTRLLRTAMVAPVAPPEGAIPTGYPLRVDISPS